MFVCVFDASCVYSFHVRKVDQGSYYGFYRFTSYFYHFLGIGCILCERLMHAVVMFFVDAVVYFGRGELILEERERLKKMAIINRRNEHQKSKLTTNQKNLLSLNY